MSVIEDLIWKIKDEQETSSKELTTQKANTAGEKGYEVVHGKHLTPEEVAALHFIEDRAQIGQVPAQSRRVKVWPDDKSLQPACGSNNALLQQSAVQVQIDHRGVGGRHVDQADRL